MQERYMTSNIRAITVRVEESIYREYQKACEKDKRSMSKQGELLIELYLKTVEEDKLDDKTG